ncbi:MAG: cob(I)yrinic acid a,c-diamide adenosyltransferase [Candidatus Aminicenantes bacterium]|nr:cob(I)yrinic acid a,c-diamide adenosyltransferase [Candidatus Aminicenantes bacterium]
MQDSTNKKKVNKDSRGYIQVYTGNGKGKTTAALGLALRAAGHGYRTFIGQFLKGQKYGELASIKKLAPLITIRQFGRKGFIHVDKDPDQIDITMAKNGLEECRQAMFSGEYKIIVLDEINVCIYFNVLEEKDVLEFLRQKPPEVEIVLTGRYAPDSFIAAADLVTQMEEIKHYYTKKVQARNGIEK